ncbi:ligand-dependent corepressor [Tachysurus fulvidraco]|uniref:ligand-dependent corepressor n=1 Tax=Tachysurus fulvidraco TaxID=1234273 RepID=UPI000F4FC613|nr:ligand-dependent corepressor [Tachysurus fulvidraco]XP_027024492.1 ligand-dependent corepressor [Tachysurus fulvidraco]XP_027024493.1 ligand-dependent corepressor [Tachysurus fulvidraco]XP_027024494.1 ligand-dependent corepressor [Tachysurus fulvidraco]
MQRMLQKLAMEYTSKTYSAQDISPSQPLLNGSKYQSRPEAPLLDPAANTTSCLFDYTDSETIITPSSQNPVLCEFLMAEQDTPLDLTIKKTGVESSNQDGVLDLSTKKKQSRISLKPSHEFSVIPVVKRQPMNTEENDQESDDKDGLHLQGLRDGISNNHTCSAPFKPLLAKSFLIKEELLSKKHCFLGQPSPISLTSLETVGFLSSSQTYPLLSRDGFWEKPQLDGVLECKSAPSHLSDLKNHPLVLENHGTFNKGTSSCFNKSFDIFTITSKKDTRNSPSVDLKIPQVKGMDLSWNSNGNISEIYNYSSVTVGCLQTDNSISRRLRAILPKQCSRDGFESFFDGGGVSEYLVTDTDQSTSGPQYPTSDPEADLTVSKQPRKKRGRYRRYNSEILEEAIGVVMSGKMSVSKAQNIYGIPHSTLEYKVKERMGTLKNPPKKKLKMIMRIDRQDSIAPETETISASTATSSTVQEDVL